MDSSASDRLDPRRCAPATQRNREPIAGVLRAVLSHGATVLEVGAGTGEHACYFVQALASLALTWLPSDPDPEARASIAAWRACLPDAAAGLGEPLELDARWPVERWPVRPLGAVVSINMIHIAPFSACEGLLRGASAALGRGGPLVLYGPFKRRGQHTAPSNAAFDADLRARDPSWGVRDLDEVDALAATFGLRLDRICAMPANNLCVVWRRDR